MSELPYDDTFEQLVTGYFDEVLDDAQQAQLKALMQEDDRKVKRFAELAQLYQMIVSEVAYQQEAERYGLSVTPSDNASESALTELASLYEDGLQDPMNFAAWREEQANKAAAVRHKTRMTRVLIGSAVAAALLFAAALLVVVFSGNEPEGQVADQQNNEQDAANLVVPAVPTPPTVATLTNTYRAQWGGQVSTAPAVGDALRSRQRLTLTAGFAEITTSRGAVATFEAPASFELIESPNGLRLHRGKLFGSCRAPSSKGFAVFTADAQIVDIGTEFGVEVDDQGQTLAHVFSGEIEVSAHGSARKDAVRVVTNQTITVSQGRVSIVQDASRQRFVRTTPTSGYHAAVLASGPMCYWRGPIEETTGLVIDHGWLDAHGQVSESLKSDPRGFVQQDASGSLQFTDSETPAFVSVSYRQAFAFQKSYSISVWCWIDPGHQDVMRIVSTRVESGGIGLGVNGRGTRASAGMPVNAPILSLFQKHDVIAERALPESRWSHLVVTVDAFRDVRMFINGKETEVKIIPGGGALGRDEQAQNQPLMIGRNPYTDAGVQAWEGRLDELAIYDRVLSPDEITQHFDATHSP